MRILKRPLQDFFAPSFDRANSSRAQKGLDYKERIQERFFFQDKRRLLRLRVLWRERKSCRKLEVWNTKENSVNLTPIQRLLNRFINKITTWISITFKSPIERRLFLETWYSQRDKIAGVTMKTFLIFTLRFFNMKSIHNHTLGTFA